jgi:hypothetical protein
MIADGKATSGLGVFNVLRGEQRLQWRSVWHPADLCVSTQEGDEPSERPGLARSVSARVQNSRSYSSTSYTRRHRRSPWRSVWHPADLCVSTQEGDER